MVSGPTYIYLLILCRRRRSGRRSVLADALLWRCSSPNGGVFCSQYYLSHSLRQGGGPWMEQTRRRRVQPPPVIIIITGRAAAHEEHRSSSWKRLDLNICFTVAEGWDGTAALPSTAKGPSAKYINCAEVILKHCSRSFLLQRQISSIYSGSECRTMSW